MRWVFISVALLLCSFVGTTYAAAVFVNNAAKCPGYGTSASPYCSIQNALGRAAAGQDIRIQSTRKIYDECTDHLNTSGTEANPITIEADTPANPPRLTCSTPTSTYMLVLYDVNHVTVQNLIFDGTGTTVPQWALEVRGACWSDGCSYEVVGDRILNNTFKNWGADISSNYANGYWDNVSLEIQGGYEPPSSAADTISGTVISGNTFTGFRHAAIETFSARNNVIENNVFSSPICGTSSGNGGVTGIIDGIHEESGVRGWPDGADIKGNTFENFPSGGCPLGVTFQESEGIHADDGASGGIFEQNLCYNFPTAGQSATNCAHIEHWCGGWIIKNNIANYISPNGASGGFFINQWGGTTATNYVYNNTVANSGVGVRIDAGPAVVENNILYDNGVQLALNPNDLSPAPAIVSDYNSVWDTSGGNRAAWYHNYRPIDLSTWKTLTGADSHSLNADPNLNNPVKGPMYNFQTTARSNTIGAGLTISSVTTDFAGNIRLAPYNIGAR